MTQDEIIEMARQAGFLINELHCYPPILSFSGQENSMEAFAKLVAASEREACAKVCDEYTAVGKIEEFDRGWLACARTIASVIRARGGEA